MQEEHIYCVFSSVYIGVGLIWIGKIIFFPDNLESWGDHTWENTLFDLAKYSEARVCYFLSLFLPLLLFKTLTFFGCSVIFEGKNRASNSKASLWHSVMNQFIFSNKNTPPFPFHFLLFFSSNVVWILPRDGIWTLESKRRWDQLRETGWQRRLLHL